jgi:hypothetical protein
MPFEQTLAQGAGSVVCQNVSAAPKPVDVELETV